MSEYLEQTRKYTRGQYNTNIFGGKKRNQKK